MPGAGGTYLPPVVAELTADKGEFVRAIVEMKAMLAALASQATAIKIVADSKPFDGKIAALRAMTNAMTATIRVDADVIRAAAKIEAVKALAGSGGGGIFGPLGAMLGLSGRGRSGGLFGWGAGLPAAGTLGAFAGFGIERWLTTLLGIGGSALQGLAGGGLLGLGAAGTMGVGMGSDLMVAKSTLADTQIIIKAQDALNKAIAVYGPASRQAAAAAENYKYQLQLLGGAQRQGVAAEIALAKAVGDMNDKWDTATQGARAAFVNNLALPLVSVANTYIPLVAAAAQKNFAIIGQNIKPLFDFLKGPGQQIFKDLEAVFAKRLPTSVQIFVQSIELLLKTIDHIATTQLTGSFLAKILEFVTRLNGTGFDKFMGQVDKVIGTFRVWMAFLLALGRVMLDIFAGAAKTGTAIVQSLTNMLVGLDKWLKSVQGKATMQTIFEVHKQEILALLQLLPILVSAIGPVYLQMSIIFTRLTIPIITLIVQVLNFLTHIKGGVGTVISFALGLALLELKSRLLINTFLLLRGALTLTTLIFGLTRAVEALTVQEGIGAGIAASYRLGLLGIIPFIWSLITGLSAAIVAQLGLNAAQAAFVPFAIVLGIAAVIGALVWFVTHLKQVREWLVNVYTRFQYWINIMLNSIGPIGVLIRWIVTLILHFQELVRAASKLPVIGFIFKGLADSMSSDSAKLAANAQKSADQFSSAWEGAVGNVQSSSKEAYDAFIALGDDMDLGIAYGIMQNQAAIDRALRQAIDNADKAARGVIQATSPSRLFAKTIGLPIVQGIAKGISEGANLVAVALNSATAPGSIAKSTGLASGGGRGGGGSITLYFSPNITISGPVANNPQSLSRELRKQLQEQLQDVLKGLKGGSYMPGQGLA